MYDENSNFTSDLVNSYAWDTAIVFIEKYSDGNSNYANETPKNDDLGNTGKREDGTTDKVCNIYDMASNFGEWTTETSMSTSDYNSFPCVYRGGSYDIVGRVTSTRECNDSSFGYGEVFRPTLYIGSAVS